MRKLLFLIVFLCGCHSHITSVESLPKYESVDAIKKHYFTEPAYEAIKDIPMVEGFAMSPWVTGVNFWTNIASLLTLNGIGRKVIVEAEDIENQGVALFIHEYIHHLDDMDRDGDGEWIDHKAWIKAYRRMAKEFKWVITPDKKIKFKIYKYAHIIRKVELKANYWVTDLFGIGNFSEHIAYTGQLLVEYDGPDYMWDVYKSILRRPNERP